MYVMCRVVHSCVCAVCVGTVYVQKLNRNLLTGENKTKIRLKFLSGTCMQLRATDFARGLRSKRELDSTEI